MGEKRREVVAYAITYAPPGVKGGPYEGAGALGQTVPELALAYRYKYADGASPDAEWLRNNGHTARVIRIVVRAERPSPSPSEIAELVEAQARMPIMVAPSEASAVAVLRELVRAGTTLAGKTPLPKENIRVSLECFADEVRDVRTALARARRVLADSGPDPSEVVRAAMAWGHACKALAGRPLDLELEALAAVDAYRKAGGK